jgi:hypothetical protein
MATAETQPKLRILAERTIPGGEDVTLVWSPADDSTTVVLSHNGVDRILRVPNASALAAFYHPYCFTGER